MSILNQFGRLLAVVIAGCFALSLPACSGGAGGGVPQPVESGKDMDPDGNNELTLEEYVNHTVYSAHERFKKLDKDGDGLLKGKELPGKMRKGDNKMKLPKNKKPGKLDRPKMKKPAKGDKPGKGDQSADEAAAGDTGAE